MELLKKRSIGGLEAATTAKEVLAERASSAIRRAGRSIRHVVVELIYYRPYYVESAQNIPSNSCSRRLYQTGSEFVTCLDPMAAMNVHMWYYYCNRL